MQLPHGHPLFLKQISIHIENGPLQGHKTLANHKLVYLLQSEISLFWPIRELSAPLAIQSRIRQLVGEPNAAIPCLKIHSFIPSNIALRNRRGVIFADQGVIVA